MLNIIYSRSRSDAEKANNLPQQGKKRLMRFLDEEYGVICLKKYTSQEQPVQETERDENLIYLNSPCTSEDDFVAAIKNYDARQGDTYDVQEVYPHSIKGVYVYSRIKSGTQCFYGIKGSDVIKALDAYETHYALVCTNIKCLRDIRADAKKNRKLYRRIDNQDIFQLRAYCLVRETKVDESRTDTETNDVLQRLFPHFLKWVAGISEETDPAIQALVKKFQLHLEDGRPYFLPYGEDLELDFFKNVSLFNNLLIFPDCGEIDTERGWNNYKNAVSPIVEKYMGLRKARKKIFIIHPMSDVKFTLGSKTQQVKQLNADLIKPLIDRCNADSAKQFRKFIETVFKPECQKGYELRFAEDVQGDINKAGGTDFLIPKVLEELKHSDIIIADFRHYNHNCIYEAGFSHALKDAYRRVYFIAPEQQQSCMSFLSFDVSGLAFQFYNLDKMIGQEDVAKEEIIKFRAAFQLDKWDDISDADVQALTSFKN